MDWRAGVGCITKSVADAKVKEVGSLVSRVVYEVSNHRGEGPALSSGGSTVCLGIDMENAEPASGGVSEA